jgi:hypothetical protein
LSIRLASVAVAVIVVQSIYACGSRLTFSSFAVYNDTISLSLLSVIISLFSARAAESIARKSIVANLIASKEASSTKELVEAMLPRFVVDSILSKGTSLIADEYPDVAIMFLGTVLTSCQI